MARLEFCSSFLQKTIQAPEGNPVEVIEQEVRRRMEPMLGTKKLKYLPEIYYDWGNGTTQYTVSVVAPNGENIFTIWVRWIEDAQTYA